nr:unnamed protein product [Fasciola hepatica]
MRDGNIIPYDTDMDLFVLGSDEQKIRQLATARKNITVGQLNLVTRPGSYCPVLAVNPEWRPPSCCSFNITRATLIGRALPLPVTFLAPTAGPH